MTTTNTGKTDMDLRRNKEGALRPSTRRKVEHLISLALNHNYDVRYDTTGVEVFTPTHWSPEERRCVRLYDTRTGWWAIRPDVDQDVQKRFSVDEARKFLGLPRGWWE